MHLLPYSHGFPYSKYCSVSSLFMKPLINVNKGLYNWVILAYVIFPKSANTEFRRRLSSQCFVNCVAAKYFIIKIQFV